MPPDLLVRRAGSRSSAARSFDAHAGLVVLGEIVRQTAPPAGPREICEQGLASMATALSATAAAIFVADVETGRLRLAGAWKLDGDDLRPVAEDAIRSGEPVREIRARKGRPRRCVILMSGTTSPLGAIVLERPRRWNAASRAFARSASRVIAAALRTAGMIRQSRAQREQLAERNLQLDILNELAIRLQELAGDEEMLQGGLDLLLRKLGLESGWIFVGEQKERKLELVASRGLPVGFAVAPSDDRVPCDCQEVFRPGGMPHARNTVACQRFKPESLDAEPIAHACVPLKFERGLLGVLNLVGAQKSPFSDAELQFLETAGKQMCMAVDRARTNRAERRRNAESRALAALARAIGGSLDPARVLDVVGDYARELLGANFCAVLLKEGLDRHRLAHLTGSACACLEPGKFYGLAELGLDAAAPVLDAGLVFTVDTSSTDPRVDREATHRHGIGSALVVPLRAHGDNRGILLAARTRPSSWTLEQVELADALGRQAALSIDNARLFSDAETALRRLQQAQDAMMRAERLAAVGTLAASLAHEVRNPLNSINLQLVLLERRLGRLTEADRAEMIEYVEAARTEINRLDALVQESLSLASVDRLASRHARPDETLREVVGLMSPLARERGVEVRQELADTADSVPIDPEKLKQVLINLVRNAIEAMPHGGLLSTSTRADDNTYVIAIADTGVGIEPGLDVFDLFVTTKPDGTGLGLPIARRIVEAHGGSLAYESAPNRGTTFTVTLKVPGWKTNTERS